MQASGESAVQKVAAAALVTRSNRGSAIAAVTVGSALARPDIARNYKLIWIGCGTADNVCRGSRVFAERLDAAKVAHTWREYSGAHQMPVFRRELVDLLQVLFR